MAPRPQQGTGVGRRASLSLTLACDSLCLFCAQEGLPPRAVDRGELPAQLDALRSGGFNEVTFAGGEPALVPWLADAVTAARAAGFARVGLQTNGRRAAESAARAVATLPGIAVG